MTVAPPRVYLHDASFTRLGRLSRASSVSRSFTMENRDIASFSLETGDPLILQMRPGLGRLVAIESTSYPVPWVGKITAIKGDEKSKSIKVTCKGYASILDSRYTSPSFTSFGAADAVIHQALREINQINPTAITWGGGGAGGQVFQLNAPNQKARSVFDSAARLGGIEWTIDADASPEGIAFELRAPKYRGLDRFSDVHLVNGKNGAVSDWKEDGEEAAFGLLVVGGFDAATQSVNDRPIARLESEAKKIESPHGYALDGAEIAANLLTRLERIYVSEELKAAGSASAAAAAILAREGGVARRSIRGAITDSALWGNATVGDVIRVSSETAFLEGYDGPARVIAVQPMEEKGRSDLVLQILQPRATSVE